MKQKITYLLAAFLLISCAGNYKYEGKDLYGKRVKLYGEQGMYLEHPYSVGDTVQARDNGEIWSRGSQGKDYVIGFGWTTPVVITKQK